MMKEKSFLQNDAYGIIKNRILSGELSPDTLYSETRLSAELGISRTPVREALQCLSQDGYITVVPSRGFRIRTLNDSDMAQSIQVRCAIEGYCVFLVCKDIEKRRAQRLIRRLRDMLEDMEDSADADDGLEAFINADHSFHLALVAYAENEEFSKLFQRLMYLIRLTSQQALNTPGRVGETLEEHRQILAALESGDATKAYSLMIHHLVMPINLKAAQTENK